MNINWVLGLLIYVVGSLFVPTPEYLCSEPGCRRRFMTSDGKRKHFKRVHQALRIACKHGCGKTYASKERAELHQRTCERNQDRVPIGGGIPQQHFQNMPRGSDKTMRLVRSAMQANLRLYRRNLTERTRYEYNM